MKLGGVIFLHDISQNRCVTLDPTRMNFDVLRTLCGERAEAALIIGTTKWRDVPPEVGKRREEELTIAYRKQLIIGGSKIHRFEDSGESAWRMIYDILARFDTTNSESLASSESLVTSEHTTRETSLAEAYSHRDIASPQSTDVPTPINDIPTNRTTVWQFGDVLGEFDVSISVNDAPIDWIRANINYISNAVDDVPGFSGSEIAPLPVLLYPVTATSLLFPALQN
jgi:hypothetical protein